MFNTKSISASKLEVGNATTLGTTMYKNRSMQDFYRSKTNLSNATSDAYLWEGESEIQTKLKGIVNELEQKMVSICAERKQFNDEFMNVCLMMQNMEDMYNRLEAMTSGSDKTLMYYQDEINMVKEQIQLLDMESAKKLNRMSPIKPMVTTARKGVDGLRMFQAPADNSDQFKMNSSKAKNFWTTGVAKLIKKHQEKTKRKSKSKRLEGNLIH